MKHRADAIPSAGNTLNKSLQEKKDDGTLEEQSRPQAVWIVEDEKSR